MEYLAILNKCRDGSVERVHIEGGETGGRVYFAEPKPKPRGKNIMSGFKYAEDVKLRERLKDEQSGEYKRDKCSLEQVEDLTSIGTLPNFSDFNTDHLTQVYENYSFSTKTDKRLLIHQYKTEILEQIASNQVTIIKGVTGCGKTTQVPQFILDDNKEAGIHCNIVVTQPRRIAAISVAKRVCQERDWRLGTIVGYKIGLEHRISPDTRLLYVTTGVLLQQLITKQSLNDYTHIIIDEVHERDSETDFLLIVVKKFLKFTHCRTKVILMSATMNTAPFVDYFSRSFRGRKSEPPVIELNYHNKYPVHFFYFDNLKERLPHLLPDVQLESPGIDKMSYRLARHLIEIFSIIDAKEDDGFLGSVLIFLPGIAEIESMYETLQSEAPKNGESWWMCPLHSSITHEEQQLVFKPPPKGHRKIILTTNIAESSITVTDVKYVIDFCLTKHQVIDPETGYSQLEMAWISKSQGTQRAGRVGRVMAGRVYRFISKDMYHMLPEQSPPEITRCSLDVLILKAKKLDAGPPEEVLGLAIDPPDLTNIHKTVLYLKEVGALLLTANGKYEENDGDITFLGEVMAALPIDTKLSKLILLGHVFSLLPQAIIMACTLSMKSIFSTPFKLQLEAYNSKLSWADCSCSDPIAYLNAYTLWKHKTTLGFFKRSGGQTEEQWCRSVFIQKNIINEVSRLEKEVISRLQSLGIEITQGDSKVHWDEVEKSLILKLIIAGAFYPNYFVPLGVDEQEAVKVLSGRDPFNTVYLTGMPPNQPGKLYVHAIKNAFRFCGSDIKVYFDGSSKAYLSFGSSLPDKKSESDGVAKNLMPGKIHLPVYRAVKLRQLGIPVVIPVLTPEEATARAQRIFREERKPTLWQNRALQSNRQKTLLPSITNSNLFVRVTHIEDPSKFWVTINDEINQNKIYWIYSELNNQKHRLPDLRVSPNQVGQICIARFAEDGKYYRARIRHINRASDSCRVRVFFIDYGNEETVNEMDLRNFPPELYILKEEPPLAIQSSLAEVTAAEDKTAKGIWAKEAVEIFRKTFQNNPAIAKVYSAVNNVMAVTLYDPNILRGIELIGSELPFNLSVNYYFINSGLAEEADEPYLSREDHMKREAAETSPNMVLSTPDSFLTKCYDQAFEDFPPVNEAECRSRVTLKGPKSPLELSLYSLPKKCQGKEIMIEWNSVNSVLLDTHPMDPHQRLIVASIVSQNNSNKLTLRNTTMMPNLHGLSSLLCLLFAPHVELRADKEKTSLIGALCGLGFDPDTGVPFYPENDVEISFDTQITHNDLVTINRLRFWMDYMLGGGKGMEANLSKPDIVNAQMKIKHYILQLLHTRRPRKVPVNVYTPYEWDQVPTEDLMDPHGKSTSLYPLIWGINLIGEPKVDTALLAKMELLENYAKGKTQMRPGGTQCALCQVYVKTLPELKIHLSANQHKMKLQELKQSAEINHSG